MEHGNFFHGRALVCRNAHYGLVDQNGTEVLPMCYKRVKQVAAGSHSNSNGKMGGNLRQPQGPSSNRRCTTKYTKFVKGRAAVQRVGKWGFIDEHGNKIIEAMYQGFNGFSEGLAGVNEMASGYLLIQGDKKSFLVSMMLLEPLLRVSLR